MRSGALSRCATSSARSASQRSLPRLGVTGHETLRTLSETTQNAAPSDLPIISDHCADTEASDIGTELPQWVEYQRAATRATEAPLRIDPADVHRHANLKTFRESRKTSFGIGIALVAALGVAVSWSYEELRSFVGNSIANAASLTADFAQGGAPAELQATSEAAEADAPAMSPSRTNQPYWRKHRPPPLDRLRRRARE